MVGTLLTARQVGDLLEVDTTTVYRMAGDGRLPAVRIGRQWRFPAGVVDQLLSPGRPAAPVPDGTAAAVPAPFAAALLETVAPTLGVTMVVTDVAGRPITRVVNPAPYLEARLADPAFLAACVHDWAAFASEPELTPRLRPSRFGFLCAHSWVRSGATLVAMVLAGGIAPGADGADGVADRGVGDGGLFALEPAAQELVLDTLPRVAALLSRLVADPATGPTEP